MTATALVTGATSGIGQAVAKKLAELGIHVLVVGRNKERGEKTIAAIRATSGQADFIQSDLRDASSAREVARRAVELATGMSISSSTMPEFIHLARLMKRLKNCSTKSIRST